MEKVTSNNATLSNNLLLIDISKNMMQKSDVKSDISFKDYVKSNSNDNKKFETKRQVKNNAQGENQKSDIQERGVKNNSLKKDERVVKDGNVKNTSDDKTQDKNVADEKTRGLENRKDNSKVNENTQKTDDENIKDKDVQDLQDLQDVPNLMYNLVNQSQIQEENEIVSHEMDIPQVELVNQDDNEQKTAHTDVKQPIEEEITSNIAEKQVKKADTAAFESEDIAFEIKDDTVGEKSFSQLMRDVKLEDTKEKPLQETQISKTDVSKEIASLKNDAVPVINDVKNIEVPLNNQESNIESPVNNIVDVTGNIRTFFSGNKVINPTMIREMPGRAHIQNFANVVDEMRIAFKGNKTTFDIKLEPESLGKLSVRINSENGVFNASFFVDSQRAKEAIENDLHILRQTLLEQGVNIQDINVQVGDNNQETNYHQNILEAINFSKKGGGRISLDDVEFDEIINPYMKSEDLFNDLI